MLVPLKSFALGNMHTALQHGPVASGILLLGLAVSFVAYFHLQNQVESSSRRSFEAVCKDILIAFERRLIGNGNLLLGVRGLFAATEWVERGAFRDYITSLNTDTEFPAIVSVNFARRVRHDAREAFEAKVRADTHGVHSGLADFRIRPPGERAEYEVIEFIEPYEKFSSSVGNDLLQARSVNTLGFERMRDTGAFSSSGELILGAQEPTLALRLPIYRAGAPAHTVAERRAAYLGSVGIGFSLQQLLRSSVAPETLQSLHFRLHRVGIHGQAPSLSAPQESNLLIDSNLARRNSGQAPGAAPRGDAMFSYQGRIEWGTRVLGVYFDGPMSRFVSPMDRWLPKLVLLLGILVSLLVFAVLCSMRRYRLSLEHAVAERTRRLAEINRALTLEAEERRRLEREVFRVSEQERKRVAQTLHDGVGQRLAALGFMVESLLKDLSGQFPEASRKASLIGKRLGESAAQVRQLAKGYFLEEANAADLSAALSRLARDMRRSFGIRCELRDASAAPERDPVIIWNLCRVTQEAVLNAVKHGKATSVTISLAEENGKPWMSIADNGVGMAPPAPQAETGIGLLIMRHRCNILGLGISFADRTGGGVEVLIAAASGREIAAVQRSPAMRRIARGMPPRKASRS